jgi:hypothetical protein
VLDSFNGKIIFKHRQKGDNCYIGIYTLDNNEVYNLNFKNNKSLAIYANIKDYVMLFIPLLIKAAWGSPRIREILEEEGKTTSEEDFLDRVVSDLKDKENEIKGRVLQTDFPKLVNDGQEGGGRFINFLKSINIKDSIRKRKESASTKTSSVFSLGKGLINTLQILFIFKIIYFIYENLIDESGRYIRLEYNGNTLGINIKKDINSESDGKYIPLTGVFTVMDIDEHIEKLKRKSDASDEQILEVSEKGLEVGGEASDQLDKPEPSDLEKPEPSDLEKPDLEKPDLEKSNAVPVAKAYADPEIVSDDPNIAKKAELQLVQGIAQGIAQENIRRCENKHNCNSRFNNTTKCKKKCEKNPAR